MCVCVCGRRERHAEGKRERRRKEGDFSQGETDGRGEVWELPALEKQFDFFKSKHPSPVMFRKYTCRYLYFKRKALVEFRAFPRPRAERGPRRDRERNAVVVVGMVAASDPPSPSSRLLTLASSRKGSIKQATTVEFPARKLPSCSHRAVLAKKTPEKRGKYISVNCSISQYK